MKVICITGGIGSGKTTVSEYINKLGYEVIDADKISRELMNKGQSVYNKVLENFGEDVLDFDQSIDRKKLSSIVFGNPDKLEILNEISHKEIISNIEKKIEILKDCKKSIVFLDVPLFKKVLHLIDELWVVDSTIEIRKERVAKRSNLTFREIEKRMKNQLSRNEYLEHANKVIFNNGSIRELQEEVEKLLEYVLNSN